MKRFLVAILSLSFATLSVAAQTTLKDIHPDEIVPYLITESDTLRLHIFKPKGADSNPNGVSIIQFHGGGWKEGNYLQFYPQCKDFSDRGYFAVSVEYRLMGEGNDYSPFTCVEDAKSAIRFIKKNAERWGLDPKKVVASGASAGGHMAACTAIFAHNGEKQDYNSIPAALVLYNPVVDTSDAGFGSSSFKGDELMLSPTHSVRKGLPPTIMFHGTADKVVPLDNAIAFERMMKGMGNRCDLFIEEGIGHGCFSSPVFRGDCDPKIYERCVLNILDFLRREGLASSNKECLLPSDPYYTFRQPFNNSKRVFEAGKSARVAFLGGSITYNPGWSGMVSDYLRAKYPDTKFEFINAGIPSNGSTSAVYRVAQDVLSKGKVDLMFVEAAVNDISPGLRNTTKSRIRAMEGIVRHAKGANMKMDLAFMYFVDERKMVEYNAGVVPQEIADHDRVAEHYNISAIDLAREVGARINNNEFTWADDFRNLHPSPFGQEVYARSIKRFLDVAYDSATSETLRYEMPEKIDPYCIDNGALVAVEKAEHIEGFEYRDLEYRNSGDMERYLCADEVGANMRFKFKGSAIGLLVTTGPEAGEIEYRIDGGEWVRYNLFTYYSWLYNIPRRFDLESELDRKKSHVIEIRVCEQTHPWSKGNLFAVSHFLVNP